MKLSKEKQEAALKHFGTSEKNGEYDDTVVAQDDDGKDVTIGAIRKAQTATPKAKKK